MAEYRIQNAQRLSADDIHEQQTVGGEFEEQKSIRARSRRLRRGRNLSTTNAFRRRARVRGESVGGVSGVGGEVDVDSEAATPSVSPPVLFINFVGLGVAGLLVPLLFFFNLLSLIAFGVDAVNRGVAAFLNWVTFDLVKGMVDWLSSALPFDDAGFFFLGINFFIIFTFFVIFGYLHSTKGNSPLRSIGQFFLTCLLFFFSAFPFINLFPWPLVWIIYMNISTTAVVAKKMVVGRGTL